MNETLLWIFNCWQVGGSHVTLPFVITHAADWCQPAPAYAARHEGGSLPAYIAGDVSIEHIDRGCTPAYQRLSELVH